MLPRIMLIPSLAMLLTGRALNYSDRGNENRRAGSPYLLLMDRMGVQLPRFGDSGWSLAHI